MMRSKLHKFGLVLLVFLLSPFDSTYAATDCVLLCLKNTRSCRVQSGVCPKSHCCRQQSAENYCLTKTDCSSQAKSCPLKVAVSKSFDPMVMNGRGKVALDNSFIPNAILKPETVSLQEYFPCIQITVSPPDLIILQRNLRI